MEIEFSDLGSGGFFIGMFLHCSANKIRIIDQNTKFNAIVKHNPVGVYIDTTGSPNVCFQTECNGDCTIVGIGNPYVQKASIYPSPTNHLIILETEQPAHYSIDITSLNGQLMYSTEMKGNTHNIDLSSFQKGVYVITVRSRDFVRIEKIIKL